MKISIKQAEISVNMSKLLVLLFPDYLVYLLVHNSTFHYPYVATAMHGPRSQGQSSLASNYLEYPTILGSDISAVGVVTVVD